MPEGMKVRGSGGLAQAPSSLTRTYLYIWLSMAWQDTLELGAIDSTPETLTLFPVPRNWT
jgi:hypothetical protein